MKKHILLVATICMCTASSIISAQEKSYILSSAINASANYEARDFILLSPGFSFNAQGGKSFSAKINEHLLFPANYMSAGELPDPEQEPDLSLAVGAVLGDGDVSPTGAATYQIPIQIPAGINNMTPNISVNYNSQSGNGLLGYGWHLSAFSAITRTGSTWYHDGEAAAPTLTESDNLLLDGQRLIRGNPASLTEGALYFTEIESYASIVYKTINSRLCFEIKMSNGVTLEYGSTDDSFVEAADTATAYCWLLSKATDLNGNYIKYTYSKEPRTKEFFIKQIEYAGNNILNIASANKIEFFYEIKSNIEKGYFAGEEISQKVILKQIKTFTNKSIIREYKFNYYNDGYYSKLIKIEECDPNGEKYNPTIIDWGDYDENPVKSWSEEFISLTGRDVLQNCYPLLGDFNGDGRMDILSIPDLSTTNNGSITLFLNFDDNGKVNFRRAQTMELSNNEIKNILIGDLNGDGKTDLIIVSKIAARNQFRYSYYWGIDSGFSTTNTGSFSVNANDDKNTVAIIADFNGDGKDEVLVKNTGELYDDSGTLIASGNIGSWEDEYAIADFNGDGKMDIFSIYTSPNKNIIYIYTLDGNTFSHIPSFSENTSFRSTKNMHFGDFNNDGKTDFITERPVGNKTILNLFTSTGTSFQKNEIERSSSIGSNISINKNYPNGKTEIYSTKEQSRNKLMFRKTLFNNTEVNIESYISENMGYEKLLTHNITGKTNFFYADFDGDGRTEFMLVSSTKQFNLLHYQDQQKLLVLKIKNGLGQSTSFDYAPLTCESVYSLTDTMPIFPVIKNKIPLYVVKTKTQTDESKSNFYYKDLYIHRQGKGMLGFGETRVENPQKNEKLIINYGYNTSYYNTYINKQQRQTYSGDPISTIEYTSNYIYENIDRIFPYYSKIIQIDHLTGVSTATTNSSLEYGIPKTVIIKYGDDLTVTQVKDINNIITEDKRIIGLPTSIRTTKQSNNQTWVDRSLFSYNANYQLETKTDYTNNGTKKVNEENYLYDGFGNLIQLTSKPYNSIEELTEKYIYSTDGRFIERMVDPMGLSTTYSYNNKAQCILVKDHYGQTTSYKYDGFGRNTVTNYPDGTQKSIIRAWNSNCPNSLFCIIESSTGQPTAKIYYDKLGREIRQSVTRIDNTEAHTDKQYDLAGRLSQTSLPFTGNAATLWNTYAYDNYNRLTSVSYASGKSETYSYTGNTVTETRENITYTRTKNAAGLVTKAIDPGGSINYSYYPDGRPKYISIANGPRTSFQYDEFGRKTQIIDPSAGTITYTYDAYGNTNKEINANGEEISSSYNKHGQQLSQTTPESTTTYEYFNERLISENSSNGTASYYEYDALGRLTSVKEHATAEDWFRKTVDYDLGQIAAVNYSSDIGNLATENYEYENGHLKRIRLNGSIIIWEVNSVNEFSQPTTVNTGPIVREYLYDNYGTATGRRAYKPSSPIIINPQSSIIGEGGVGLILGTIQDHTYSFDMLNGNLSSRRDNVRRRQESFTYDELNRLNGIGNKAIEYDNLGNIISKDGVGALEYHPDRPYAVEYLTPDSEAVPMRQQTVTYTSFQRPATIAENGNEAIFSYNSRRNRVSMQMKQNDVLQFTKYYLGGQYEKDTSVGTTPTERLYLGGNYYNSFAVYQKTGGMRATYYLHRDYLGSITNISNMKGDQVAEYSYDAWGRLRNPATHVVYEPGNEPTLMFGRGYTGHEHLAYFGLVNMNARLYDPALGRFLSPDPYVQMPELTQNFNRYSYCLNNPMMYVDENGEFFWTIVSFIVDFLDTAFFQGGFDPTSSNARKEAWRNFDPSASWSKTNKAWQIFSGNFKTDSDKNFWERTWELVSRYTWQAPQTYIGRNSTQIHNLLGGVKSVDYYGGATVVQSYGKDWGAITLGNVIIGDESIEANSGNSLFQHEYGHYLQSQTSGWFYLSRYGIPSAFSKGNHSNHPSEQDANARALKYFNKHDKNYNKWDFKRHPIYGYNEFLPYNHPTNQKALENAHLGRAWYDYVLAPFNLNITGIVIPGIVNTFILNNKY